MDDAEGEIGEEFEKTRYEIIQKFNVETKGVYNEAECTMEKKTGQLVLVTR
jgi:hypothetical protein